MPLRTLKKDLSHLKENITNFRWLRNKSKQRISAAASEALYRHETTGYFNEGWDNLIILDACRADLFETNVDLDAFDEYSTKYSNASLTAEWVKKNLQDAEFSDTVYVSSNPFISMFAKENFYELVELWKDQFDDEYHTVLPETVTQQALDAYQPDKKLVAHYMQPHWPFYVYEMGRAPEDSMDILGRGETNEDEPHNPFKGLRQGQYTTDEVWKAYEETFQAVYPHALELARSLDGRTVITSDHGNLFGENLHRYIPIRLYGHPTRGLRHPDLVEVPWAVIDGERRATTDQNILDSKDLDQKAVDNKLNHLGYK